MNEEDELVITFQNSMLADITFFISIIKQKKADKRLTGKQFRDLSSAYQRLDALMIELEAEDEAQLPLSTNQ